MELGNVGFQVFGIAVGMDDEHRRLHLVLHEFGQRLDVFGQPFTPNLFLNGFLGIETFVVGFHHFCELVVVAQAQGFKAHEGHLFFIEFEAFGRFVVLHVDDEVAATGIAESVAFLGIFEGLVEVALEAKVTVIVVDCEVVGAKAFAQLNASFQSLGYFASRLRLFVEAQLIKRFLVHVGIKDATQGAAALDAFEHQLAIGFLIAFVPVDVGEKETSPFLAALNGLVVHLFGVFQVVQGLVGVCHDAVPVWVEVGIGRHALLDFFKHFFGFLVGVEAPDAVAGLAHRGELAAFCDGLVTQLGGTLQVHEATNAIAPQQRLTHQCVGATTFGSLGVEVESLVDVVAVAVVCGKPAGVAVHGVGVVGAAQHLNVGRGKAQYAAVFAETAQELEVVGDVDGLNHTGPKLEVGVVAASLGQL